MNKHFSPIIIASLMLSTSSLLPMRPLSEKIPPSINPQIYVEYETHPKPIRIISIKSIPEKKPSKFFCLCGK